MERKPLPIGIEDFKRLIDDKYYFVDKSRTFYQTKKIRKNFEYEHDSAFF